MDNESLKDEAGRVELALELAGMTRGNLNLGEDFDVFGHEEFISPENIISSSGCESEVDFLSTFLPFALTVCDLVCGELLSGVAGERAKLAVRENEATDPYLLVLARFELWEDHIAKGSSLSPLPLPSFFSS
jgi:hypothetical protein